VAKCDRSQYKTSFLQSRSKKFCFVFWQRKGKMRSFISCWLNHFVSEVLFSGLYWSSEEFRVASGEEPSSHSLCSKNAGPSCGGSGTRKLSSWWVGFISDFRFGQAYTMLYLFFAEKPVIHNRSSRFSLRTFICCVIELKDNKKLICFTEKQQYFIYFIGYQYRSSDYHQVVHTKNLKHVKCSAH
jgi:hypothetical protein